LLQWRNLFEIAVFVIGTLFATEKGEKAFLVESL
jgi:hypothetical protein